LPLVEAAAQVFRLAWKGSVLYARGKLTAELVEPLNDPLMVRGRAVLRCSERHCCWSPQDLMEALFNAATAHVADGCAINVSVLSSKIAVFHDQLLGVLRGLVSENHFKPEFALNLTKCVTLGCTVVVVS
jgi:hypothetical protein